MAVYAKDHPDLFERAIDSVYANSLVPDEFVLVQDGPVPGELEEIVQRNELTRGITVLRLPANVGLARALNQGLALVRTEWVARADADDLNLPDRFERQALAIQRHGSKVDLVGGWIQEVDRYGTPIAIRRVPSEHDDIVRRLQTRNPFNHMTIVCRKERVIEAGGYPDIHLKEDYGLWARMISTGSRCHNLQEVLVQATAGRDLYRRRGGIRYAKSEWDLQLLLYRLRHKGPISAVAVALARGLLFCLPAPVRGVMYERLLRAPRGSGNASMSSLQP